MYQIYNYPFFLLKLNRNIFPMGLHFFEFSKVVINELQTRKKLLIYISTMLLFTGQFNTEDYAVFTDSELGDQQVAPPL